MKYLIFLFSIIILSFTKAIAQSIQLDTIMIRMNSSQDMSFYPQRACVGPWLETHQNSDEAGTNYIDSTTTHKGYKDSIKVNFQVINKYNQYYYLVVFDSSGTKRLEGVFYDKFPDGKIIEYHENGNIKAKGVKMKIESKKPILTCEGSYCCPKTKMKLYDNWYSETLKWHTYSINGGLLTKSRYNQSTKESWITIYDINEEVSEILYLKKGKIRKRQKNN